MKRSLFIGLIISFNIVIDQVSKFWIRATVPKHSKSDILGNYFTLHNVENKGAFLGMGSELASEWRILFLLILPSAVMLYVLYYIFNNKALDRTSIIGFSCIVGGGLANLYDRFMYGQVTDFFHIDLGAGIKTGIFNIADMSVMFGLGLLILGNFRKKEKTN